MVFLISLIQYIAYPRSTLVPAVSSDHSRIVHQTNNQYFQHKLINHVHPTMSTLPCRDDHAVVFFAFKSKPQITQAQPKALYDQILPILIAFDNILNYILKNFITDHFTGLSACIYKN